MAGPGSDSSSGGVSARASAFDGAPLCICVVDALGEVLEANSLFELIVGPLHVFAEISFERIGADDAAAARLNEAFSATRTTGLRRKVRDVRCLVLGDGFPVAKHFDWSVSRLDEGKLCLIGELITEVDGQQREKDAELIDFFQNAPIAMHWLSADGIILWANNTELRVLGYTAEEYIGQPIIKFCTGETEIVLEIFKTLGSGASIKDVPVQFLAKDGRVVPLLIDSNVNYTKSGDFNHTRCFIRDDTGRKVNEARAELMVQELKRSAKNFDAFVSRTLHLVRTPLHVVLADLDLLKNDEVSHFEADAALKEATAVLERVVGMTADVSDIMRFEQGAALKVCRRGADLREICRAVVDAAQPLVRPGVDLFFDFGAGGGGVQADDGVLLRVLAHLLKNSAAATFAGRIVLRVSHHDAGVTISVEDDGKGLDMTDVKYVQRYSQDLHAIEALPLEAAIEARLKLTSDLRLSSGNEGLGIGLSLSYFLVQALGGELQGESAVGRGTRFWFDLPRAEDERGSPSPAEVYRSATADSPVPADSAAAAAAAAHVGGAGAAAAAGDGGACAERSDAADGSGQRRPAPPKAPARRVTARRLNSADFDAVVAPVLSQDAAGALREPTAATVAQVGIFEATRAPHVLIVEDSPLCAKVLAQMLKRAGCTSRVVGDGAQAVAVLEASASDYDLVLMDLRMPVMDGFEATRIAKQRLGVSLPIVAVTAETGFSMRDECSSCGFDDVRPKPLKLPALLALLEEHLGAAAARATAPRPPTLTPGHNRQT
ncbi:hypothetical protein M885DRAFT_100335 [Pelagophyceae sp. CCMP2097]|nr:hypothetical protein M885DRAFT_100335 [Pelagophyceae sp. CCMP2097]